jgi:AcrR family transcriptional regulator
MEDTTNGNVKERILETATELFSKKGYEGAKMNEIAKGAGVNKALIYYYFPSKQSIMDHIIKSFFAEISGVAMTFITETITRMIKEERLDIMKDRYRFRDKDALQEYWMQTLSYCENILTKLQGKKDLIRIILAESLRDSNQQDALYRIFLLFEDNDRNPLFQKIYEADNNANQSRDIVFREFFFILLPILNLVVFYDSYKTLSGMDDNAMKKAYLYSMRRTMWAGRLSGLDVMTDPILKF